MLFRLLYVSEKGKENLLQTRNGKIMKKITMTEIKKMWEDAPDRVYVLDDYCESKGISVCEIEDEMDVYEDLYPIESFLRDYYDSIFYGDECEPDEEVRAAYERAKG